METVEHLPLVSICIPTYNHARYIAKCLDGMLMQKTSFPIEILIGEDGSTDGTRELCAQYKNEYPEKIVLFLNDRKNVIYIGGKPTGRWNLINLLKNAKGKYIAVCEGDDYWTDPLKLQKQVYFLEANPGYAFCYHHIAVIQEGEIKNRKLEMRMDQPETSTIAALLKLVIWAHINSVVFRNLDILKNMPPWFSKCPSGDWALLTMVTDDKKIKYLHETMSVYRQHGGGMWSSNSKNQNQLNVLKTARILNKHWVKKKDKKYIYSPMHNACRELISYNKSSHRLRALRYLVLSFLLDLNYNLFTKRN